MKLWKKKQRGQDLSPQIAQQMLTNIFGACKQQPNTVPLQVLASYSNYRRERFALQRHLLIVVMVLFVLLPLLFMASGVAITEPAAQSGNPVYSVNVSTLIPVRRINATVDGRNVPIYEVGAREYAVQPSLNGELVVTVTLINGQVTTASAQVSAVDNDTPVLISSVPDGDLLVLHLQDAGSGINYAGVYTVADNIISGVVSFDPEAGTVSLAYPQSTTDVYIPDHSGNTLHLLLTVN